MKNVCFCIRFHAQVRFCLFLFLFAAVRKTSIVARFLLFFLQFWFVCYFLCVSRTTVCKTYIVVIFKQFVCMRGATVFFYKRFAFGSPATCKTVFFDAEDYKFATCFCLQLFAKRILLYFLCNLSIFLFLS